MFYKFGGSNICNSPTTSPNPADDFLSTGYIDRWSPGGLCCKSSVTLNTVTNEMPKTVLGKNRTNISLLCLKI
jgi:hypothetical protein